MKENNNTIKLTENIRFVEIFVFWELARHIWTIKMDGIVYTRWMDLCKCRTRVTTWRTAASWRPWPRPSSPARPPRPRRPPARWAWAACRAGTGTGRGTAERRSGRRCRSSCIKHVLSTISHFQTYSPTDGSCRKTWRIQKMRPEPGKLHLRWRDLCASILALCPDIKSTF